jgi:hypothetical protein
LIKKGLTNPPGSDTIVTVRRGSRMKAIGFLGCALAMLGLVWGIFFRELLTITVIGLIMMLFAMIFYEEE